MDDIYNDLENYDEVDLVNELRSENLDLKHKLVECTTSMEILQKDFDKLSAEFKKLEMNYSSLLKIARAEIKRKTDMITNLNIEKDILVIKATQSVPPNKVQKLIKNIGSEKKRKKKKWNKKGQKKKDELNREDCEPSETSSTATDNTNKMLSKDRGDSVKSICRNTTKENKIVKPEALPDRGRDDCRSPVGAVVDRRVSELARPPLAKLSSDEEFEDMYSALGPKTPPPREPERSRKRGRDRSQDAKTYNSSGSQDKSSSYPEPFRECFVRNKANRFSASNRSIMNRNKEYNECDRNISTDKQYSENDRNANRGNYHRKYSPERHRRIAREFGDDRYSHQYDRHRRLESPPREKTRHRSRERRPHYDRQRNDHKPGVHRYDHPDTHSVKHRIHGEYDEPQNKRPRVELHPNEQDDRRQSEKQYYKESNTDVRDRTCQSPDFSHTENESSNEPVITTTDSIEVTTQREDPRVTSTKYVKTIDGTKEVLHAVNANEVDLQPVNRSLWNLEDIQVPLALKLRPLEISEELVEEMDTDKPLSILSMESGEVGSETTDTYMDDLSDYREVDEGIHSNYKRVSSKNDNLVIKKRSIIRSPSDKTSENIDHKSDIVQMESKLTRHKLAKLEEATNYCRSDDDHKMPTKEFSDSWEVDEGISLNYKSVSSKNDNLKIEKRKDVRSRTDTTSKNVEHESDIVQLESKSAKHKLANSEEATNFSADKDSTKSNINMLDHREVDEVVGLKDKCVSSQNDNLKIEKRKDNKSLSEKTSQDTEHKYDVVQMESIRHKLGKSEGATNCFRSDEGLKMPSKEFSVHRNVDEGISSNYKGVSSKNDNLKIGGRKDKKSPIEKTSKVIELKSDVVQTDLKSTRHKLSKSEEDTHKDDNITRCKNAEKPSILERLIHAVHDKSEKADNHKADKPTKSSQDSNKVEPDVYCDNTEKPNISHRLLNSVSDVHKSPESVDTIKSKSTEEIEPKNISVLTTINNSEKEKESNVSVLRDFEHRVYSTRNIVEGDLALSDDTTDEILVKKDEKVQVKKKLKTKKKLHWDTSKEKPVDSKDTTKKTRSKKDKVQEVKPQNKFSELFGDSSSLITPEELNLATREAHALPADCCPLLCEDALDGIIQIHKPDQIPHISESRENSSGSFSIDDNLKTTNDSKNRTHKKHKDTGGVSVSNDTPKDPKELLNEAQHQKVDSTDGQLVSEIKLVLSSEKLKEMLNAKLSSDKNKSDLIKSHEKPKESLKSNKKPKSKHEKRLSTSESTEESNVKRANSLETSSNKALVVSDNKENANCNDNSDKNISSEMEKIFETVSSKHTSIQTGKVNEEKIQLNESVIEAISSNRAQDVPNLAPVIDEPGLVKTVVISTGNQQIDSSTVQCIKPLHALASSTPAKEIPLMNTTERESKNKQTACINVTIASEDSISQSETDAPDVRIKFYKRRRKLKK